jgi:tetratricopeptide (TPR) repeat protein
MTSDARCLLGALMCIGSVLAGACTSPDDGPANLATAGLSGPSGAALWPVDLPDLSEMEVSVRQQLESGVAALQSRRNAPNATPSEVGAAYGELATLLLAANYFDVAEAAFRNAQTLATEDSRWPYYLGHVYRHLGPPEASAASFERALELQPNDTATLVWLGGAYLDQGRPDAAAPVFALALELEPASASARSGMGSVALARQDHAQAATDFEQALALDPAATAIHYPLAMAYRGLGDMERAQIHLDRQNEIVRSRPPGVLKDPTRPADPLLYALDQLLQSAEAFDVRGGRALDAGDWAVAADYFREGLRLAPDNTSLRHRLGTALFQMGDPEAALAQFEHAVRVAPENTRAQFSLGVLLEAGGRPVEAIDRFTTALEHDPGYLQARVQLATLLGRSGQAKASFEHWEQAIALAPTSFEAAFGGAMALVRLERYRDARDRLTSGLQTHPDQSVFAHALARLLVAAPDPEVRDGQRAKTLVDELLLEQQSIELGETTAMMLAELGQYAQASQLQRDIINAAVQGGLPEVVRRMSENLRLYDRGEPCRTPWTQDELP